MAEILEERAPKRACCSWKLAQKASRRADGGGIGWLGTHRTQERDAQMVTAPAYTQECLLADCPGAKQPEDQRERRSALEEASMGIAEGRTVYTHGWKRSFDGRLLALRALQDHASGTAQRALADAQSGEDRGRGGDGHGSELETTEWGHSRQCERRC
jgi:hypothetical protein